jgi:hypothetical protein
VKVFEFVHAENAHHKIATMCRLLGVSRRGYHAWAARSPSPRSVRDAEITQSGQSDLGAVSPHLWRAPRARRAIP